MQVVHIANATQKKTGKTRAEILRAKAIELTDQLNSRPSKNAQIIIQRAFEKIENNICINQTFVYFCLVQTLFI